MSYKKKGLFKENIELSHGGLDAWLWGDGKGGGGHMCMHNYLTELLI